MDVIDGSAGGAAPNAGAGYHDPALRQRARQGTGDFYNAAVTSKTPMASPVRMRIRATDLISRSKENGLEPTVQHT
jgi:hypothetical protein